MTKFLFRFFFTSFLLVFLTAIFLSYFGLETDKFNDLIKNKANESHKYVKLDFTNTKIHLNPKEFNLAIKLLEPKILVKDNEIILSKLNLFLPLRAFITSDFLLQKAQIAFVENDIKDLTKITTLYIPRIFNKQLKKIFNKGKLKGEFIIPFEKDGSMGKNYEFSGEIINAYINLPNGFLIKNLSTEMSYGKEKENSFNATIKNGSLFDIELIDSTINLKSDNNQTKVKSILHTNGNISFSQFKEISALLGLKTNSFKNIEGNVDLETEINFNLNKKFKVKNLLYSTTGNISNLEIEINEKKIIKVYLPEFDSKIVLKDTNIKLFNSKSDITAELDGSIKTKDNFDKFRIKKKYKYIKKLFEISGSLDLTSSKFQVDRLNYLKDYGVSSEINFNVNFILNKNYNINNVKFSSGENKILLLNIKLNKNFEIEDLKKIEIKTTLNAKKNNDFSINKNKKVSVSGKIFDAQPLLKSLYKKSEKKIFSKKFNSEIKVNFDKTLTGTNDDVSNFSMVSSIRKGSFNKLSLKGNFSNNEIVEMSIYQVDNDKKTLQVISDRARPFVKNFDFIKGFEGGKLEYEAVISNKISNSNLIITDFKVSKVPALAKLLTLASLQGIADTLSGEGIRFESFEMKSNSKGNLINIEDALAIGPAVSILLDGYVDKGKTVSLRGTLVPATKLNSIIASIPLVGDILVGKKTGEGVVGVSFKMKGPPKNIKTTVNPIKTLTPRFIVRAVEKMKKKKQEESK
tara:strand:- start:45 stop:2279 length:2235 start_codon:yes stop_codon:yes gene_type:complete